MDYELINWGDDYDISADRLNHMDTGIKNASNELDNCIKNTEKGITIPTLIEGKIPTEQLPDSSGGVVIPENIMQINNSYLFTENTYYGTGLPPSVKSFGIKTGGARYSDGVGLIVGPSLTGLINFGNATSVVAYNMKTNKTEVIQPTGEDSEIASCKYVNDKSASMDMSLLSTLNQCWKKDASGIIHQFIDLEATKEEIDIQLPVSFPEKCLFVGVEILNPQKDSSVSNIKFETIEKGLDSVKILKIGTGTPTISVMALGI